MSVLLSACFVGEAEPQCGMDDDLAESVFRFQFANNRSSIQQKAAAYFIAVENDQDPSGPLLNRFADHLPPVKALSDLTMSTSDSQVVDPVSGKPALIFRIYKRSALSNTEAVVEGGYHEANLSASWITMRAMCQQGAWRIEIIGPEKIAGQQ